MAKIYHRKSSYLKRQEKKNRWYSDGSLYLAEIISVIIVFKTVVVLVSNDSTAKPLSSYLLFVIPALIVLAVVLLIHSGSERTSKNFKQGREGEELVRKELVKLSDSYAVNIDGILGFGNIDFTVQKENILFNIEVKSHKGRITSNGWTLLRNRKPLSHNDPILQAKNNEKKLKTALSEKVLQPVEIVSLVVFSSPHCFVDVTRPVKNVHVLHKKDLRQFIETFTS